MLQRFALGTLGCIMALCLVACDAPQEQGPIHDPYTFVSRTNNRKLERLYDATSSVDDQIALAAATEISELPFEDITLVSAYWGSRGKSPDAARGIGDSLAVKAESMVAGRQRSELVPEAASKLANESILWMRRALGEINTKNEYVAAAYYRLVMARALLVLRRDSEAIELLTNRLDTRPLPPALELEYEAALSKLLAS